MRIVIDANVLIAALTQPRGAAARIVRAWRDGRFEVAASEATLREAELVLGGGWLARAVPGADAHSLLARLRERSARVDPARIAGLRLKDEGDRRLVETAAASGAAYLVTADREVLAMRGYGAVEFVTPSEFLRLVD